MAVFLYVDGKSHGFKWLQYVSFKEPCRNPRQTKGATYGADPDGQLGVVQLNLRPIPLEGSVCATLRRWAMKISFAS